MPLKKQITDDESDIPSESQHNNKNTQEHEAVDDEDNKEEFSSSLLSPSTTRHKRRRERENQSKDKEMTEDEMMDLALRLSEQEASDRALRLQQEEEAMMKAIQESMVSQTQRNPPSQSQSLLGDGETSLRLCSRRKLLYPNGKKASSVIDQRASQDVCTSETDLSRGVKGSGDENNGSNKKRKRKEGSPLLEMPDLSQTQKMSQASPCSSVALSLHLDSPQSSDSTQIDDCELPKSPVFPLTGCRAEVQVPRLSQDLLETCKSSGFVLCSQDTWISTQVSLPVQPKSPTFPKSSSNPTARPPKSPVLSEADQGDEEETDLGPEYPVFGRTQREGSSSACKSHSGFMFSSQDSLTSSVRSSSCRPQSPDDKAELKPDSRFNSTSSQSDEAQDLNEASKEWNLSETELTSDMTLHWSERTRTSRPVFPEERALPQADCPASSLNHVTTTRSNCSLKSNDQSSSNKCASLGPSSSASSSSPTSTSQSQPSTTNRKPPAARSSQGAAGSPTVHYYWGVPFCPRGLDPEAYTQVILAQMQVYDRSVKQAQRCLLRKIPWGEPILPQPEKSPSPEPAAESPPHQVLRRQGLRLRRNKLCEPADASPAKDEEEEEKKDGEEEEREGVKEDKAGGEENEGQMDADDCEVCPETQLSNNDDDDTQDLTMVTDAADELRPEGPRVPEVTLIIQDTPPEADPQAAAEEEEEEEMEVEDGKLEGNALVGDQMEEEKEAGADVREDPDVEEITHGRPKRSASPELDSAPVPQSHEAQVDCPICQGSFPATKIELHAAYCDGEVAMVDERRPEVSQRLRSKRARRAEGTAEETADENQEKCYVCQKAIPLRDYSRHTELCIRRQRPSKTHAVRLRNSTTTPRGNLLSALEQTETRDSER
ncbi:hypothetical protein INR49_009530 [Caranx melampygus]|nr:hypothetical protein INR49_009530 [Caranx melampygus]